MSHNLKKFWWELKRRKVFRVLAMYAGAAFVVIEVTNNVVEPLGLPPWLPTLVILVLIAGFPVAAILSWLFDITASGVVKTPSVDGVPDPQEARDSDRRKLRASDIVIAVLIIAVGILIYPRIFHSDDLKDVRDREGKISIAVMPFENLSGDTLFNIWQGGIQNLLISTLSNSSDLNVRKYQAVNELLDQKKEINRSSLSTSFAGDVAHKLDSRTFILGNILKAGEKIRINAQLVDTDSEEIYKSYQIDGDSENDFFMLADSLSTMVRNYMEIKKISDAYNAPEIQGNQLTNSSEAFKNYIRGWDAFKYIELESAVDWFSKAVAADSSFTQAYVFNAYASLMNGRDEQAKKWCHLAIKMNEGLPDEESILLGHLNAYFNETPYEEIKYAKQLIEFDELNPLYWHLLGFAYYKLYEYADAAKSWEQVFKIHEKWGTDYSNPYIYFLMGDAYHQLGEHEKEEKILALGNRINPNAIMIQQHQAICALTHGETQKAKDIIAEYKSIRSNVLYCTEAMIATGLGEIYAEAGMLEEAEAQYRETLKLEPDNLYWVRNFAWFLIDNEINIEEGLQLTERILSLYPNYWPSLDAKGWALYKQGKTEEALALLKDAWERKVVYSHRGYLHIQEVEKALEKQKMQM